jgi:hypothetical protein
VLPKVRLLQIRVVVLHEALVQSALLAHVPPALTFAQNPPTQDPLEQSCWMRQLLLAVVPAVCVRQVMVGLVPWQLLLVQPALVVQ